VTGRGMHGYKNISFASFAWAQNASKNMFHSNKPFYFKGSNGVAPMASTAMTVAGLEVGVVGTSAAAPVLVTMLQSGKIFCMIFVYYCTTCTRQQW